MLEIRRAQTSEHVATMEFDRLPLLRIALAENRDKKFIIEPPANATAEDRITLLDLRAQGFDIAVRTPQSG
jgi:hypothetical protein